MAAIDSGSSNSLLIIRPRQRTVQALYRPELVEGPEFFIMDRVQETMLTVDGSDSGGQFLRTALALATLTGQSVKLTNIRGGRSPRGLRPQHLAAVQLLAEICDADVEGTEEGSTDVTFEPGPPLSGTYSVDIGTAGSVTLVFDTVLPIAAAIDGPLTIVAAGGTDVKWSPTMPYYSHVKLPLLRRFGLHAALELDRSGYYPQGGGNATLRVAPSAFSPFMLTDRGDLAGAHVYSKAARALAESNVAERQASTAASRLEAADIPVTRRVVMYETTDSPGSAVCIRLKFANTMTGFDAHGERGKPSEDVAAEAVQPVLEFIDGTATVDRYMADQLAVFLALTGGRIRIPTISSHVETSVQLLSAFGYDVGIERSPPAPVLVGS